MAYVSPELLFHMRCSECQLWFTIEQQMAMESKLEQVFCPACGVLQDLEPALDANLRDS